MRAQRDRTLDAVAKKPGVDRAVLKVPNARDDIRVGVACGNTEEFAGATHDLDRFPRSRVTGQFADGARENPGMPALERFLAACFQYQLVHLTSAALRTSSLLADARRRKPWRAAENRDGCKPASSRCSRDR